MTVYLIPNVPIEERRDLVRMANTDAQDNFVMYGVAPGEYFLSSSNDLDPSRESPTVRVSGETAGIHLVLGPDRGLHRVP